MLFLALSALVATAAAALPHHCAMDAAVLKSAASSLDDRSELAVVVDCYQVMVADSEALGAQVHALQASVDTLSAGNVELEMKLAGAQETLREAQHHIRVLRGDDVGEAVLNPTDADDGLMRCKAEAKANEDRLQGLVEDYKKQVAELSPSVAELTAVRESLTAQKAENKALRRNLTSLEALMVDTGVATGHIPARYYLVAVVLLLVLLCVVGRFGWRLLPKWAPKPAPEAATTTEEGEGEGSKPKSE